MYASGAGTYVSAAHTTVRVEFEEAKRASNASGREAREDDDEGLFGETDSGNSGGNRGIPSPSIPRAHASPAAARTTSPARSNTPSAYTHPCEGFTSTRRNTAVESRAATSRDSQSSEPEPEPEPEPELVPVAATNAGSAEPTRNTSAATSSRVVIDVGNASIAGEAVGGSAMTWTRTTAERAEATSGTAAAPWRNAANATVANGGVSAAVRASASNGREKAFVSVGASYARVVSCETVGDWRLRRAGFGKSRARGGVGGTAGDAGTV